ncbi:MAG: polyhydroxyalkanoic acid system family protein [Candidatus Paceibacterota bacterium]
MKMSIDHELSEAEALKRIKKLLGETKKQYGDMVTDLKEKWQGNKGNFSFAARGYTISGTMVVSAGKVLLEGELPWTLNLMRGRIEKIIKERAKVLLK